MPGSPGRLGTNNPVLSDVVGSLQDAIGLAERGGGGMREVPSVLRRAIHDLQHLQSAGIERDIAEGNLKAMHRALVMLRQRVFELESRRLAPDPATQMKFNQQVGELERQLSSERERGGVYLQQRDFWRSVSPNRLGITDRSSVASPTEKDLTVIGSDGSPRPLRSTPLATPITDSRGLPSPVLETTTAKPLSISRGPLADLQQRMSNTLASLTGGGHEDSGGGGGGGSGASTSSTSTSSSSAIDAKAASTLERQQEEINELRTLVNQLLQRPPPPAPPPAGGSHQPPPFVPPVGSQVGRREDQTTTSSSTYYRASRRTGDALSPTSPDRLSSPLRTPLSPPLPQSWSPTPAQHGRPPHSPIRTPSPNWPSHRVSSLSPRQDPAAQDGCIFCPYPSGDYSPFRAGVSGGSPRPGGYPPYSPQPLSTPQRELQQHMNKLSDDITSLRQSLSGLRVP